MTLAKSGGRTSLGCGECVGCDCVRVLLVGRTVKLMNEFWAIIWMDVGWLGIDCTRIVAGRTFHC